MRGCARGAQKGCKLHPLHPLILFRNLYHYIGGDTPRDTDIDIISVSFLFAFGDLEIADTSHIPCEMSKC